MNTEKVTEKENYFSEKYNSFLDIENSAGFEKVEK